MMALFRCFVSLSSLSTRKIGIHRASSTWTSKGLSQQDLMIQDQCILVDEMDKIIGSCSKKDGHIFSPEFPRAKLHRAFSVFLFNPDGKLLLQQRAHDKVTFPGVWTNTCCSHPLFGCSPNEVDEEIDVNNGKVDGVKNAAVRKLKHELGIFNPIEINNASLKYLTRLHYWAADTVTHGKNSPWGEHEIDYILFVKTKELIEVQMNREEVSDVKYVDKNELKEMMQPSNGLLWSPWFRIIAEKFLVHWWDNLDETLTTSKFQDFKKIHSFDPTPEHMGGAGNAGSWLNK